MRDNMNKEAAHLRDTFLEAEKEYVKELLKNEEIRQIIIEINEIGSDALFETAKSIVNKIESGLVPDEQMEREEQILIVLLAAIKDNILIKELVFTPSIEPEETHNLHR